MPTPLHRKRCAPDPTAQPRDRTHSLAWRALRDRTTGSGRYARDGAFSDVCRGKIRRYAFPGTRRWQDIAKCVLGRLVVAIFSRDASPSVRRWRDCALMRSWPDWQRQYSRAVRSRGSCRGKIPPRCVPGRQSVASFSPHASRKGPRTGKSPVRGKIRAPCIRKRAGFGKICAPCIRNAPQIAVGGYTARRSCQEGALFAARAPRIMHGAQILPSFGA